ncbi:pentapeptide repeat-containing protein [Rhodococcus sp. USK10]|uniref:pentapeptide repeat-containing protein n=1 Tax=Rhodococcus sp. USK10 TaxID=2789739 RepID=UPI001C5E9560|nr:pentapeptide repeat-containing protein [Rhodococcus sp. USK10]QYB08222.1 pentapeptide repeat-containing protein [Rhodococcus sp. USK10]
MNESDHLAGANLLGAKLTGANLTKANLTRAVLTIADLTGANLTGTDFTESSLALTTAPHFKIDEVVFDIAWHLPGETSRRGPVLTILDSDSPESSA